MKLKLPLAIVLAAFATPACQTPRARHAAVPVPFGSNEEVAYAKTLWQRMMEEKLVGAHQKDLKPFFGGAPPHGTILELADQVLKVDGHSGFLVVKRNYNGPGVSVDAVAADRARFLSSVTIMYQREPGYDTDNQDWFWVKYKPDGRLFKARINGMKLPMAGRIIKGKTPQDSAGCIYCHSSAGGGDYIFYPDIKKPAPD